jgi:hypothetical protein
MTSNVLGAMALPLSFALSLALAACGKPSSPTATPTAAPAAPPSSAAPAAASGPAFCETMKSKCPSSPPMTADDVALCKRMVADPKCGAVYLAAMQCDQRIETCDPETGRPKPFTACHDEHAAAEACMTANGQ